MISGRIALVILSVTATSAQRGDTPAQVVGKFVSAYSRKDFKTAASYVIGANQKADFSALKIVTSWPKFSVTHLATTIQNDSASVTCKIQIADPHEKPVIYDDNIDLKLVGSNWKIFPVSSTNAGNDNRVVGTLAMTIACPEIMATAKASAAGAVCESNLRQIVVAALIYAADHRDRLDLTVATAQNRLRPYLSSKANWWHCKSDKSSRASYSFNNAIANHHLDNLTVPAETVLFYEGHGGNLELRHKGKAGVAFADGHVKLVDKQAARRLRWKP